MEIYDCHVHTTYSFDGKATIGEQCDRAISLGLRAITVTDHTTPVPKGYAYCENIRKSVEAANRKKEELEGTLLVLSGMELGDPLTCGDERYKPFYDIKGVDCILGSVHSGPIFKTYFPNNPYGSDLRRSVATADMDFLKRFVERYYTEVLKLVEKADVDVITHLTFPLRYINGQANRGFDITEFDALIDEVLKAIIKTGKTLEVNTSGYAGWGEFMPNSEILKRYFALGGRHISLGSDAHRAAHLSVGIPEAMELLKKIGFTHGSYFVNRERMEYIF